MRKCTVVFLVFTVTRRKGECYWKLVMESEIINVLQCLGQTCCPIQKANNTSVEECCKENFLLKRVQPYAMGSRGRVLVWVR